MTTKSLSGKVALVTGASSGMGRAISLMLQKEGANIICCDLRPDANPKGFEEDLETTTHDLVIRRGGEAMFQKVDISDLGQIEDAFAAGTSRFGRIDILVNCAGYYPPPTAFVDESDETWTRTIAINTMGTSKAMRLAIKHFLTHEVDEHWGSRGRIVSIASSAGHVASAGQAAYSATKASVIHMTAAAAADHAKDSINVNCVAPGIIATAMSRDNFDNEQGLAAMKKSTPWPRLGTANDVAAAMLFLLQPQSAFITGQRLTVDGGFTLGPVFS